MQVTPTCTSTLPSALSTADRSTTEPSPAASVARKNIDRSVSSRGRRSVLRSLDHVDGDVLRVFQLSGVRLGGTSLRTSNLTPHS